MSYPLIVFRVSALRRHIRFTRAGTIRFCSNKINRFFLSRLASYWLHARFSRNGTPRNKKCPTRQPATGPTRQERRLSSCRSVRLRGRIILTVYCRQHVPSRIRQPSISRLRRLHKVLPTDNAPFCGAFLPCQLHGQATRRPSRRMIPIRSWRLVEL